ncbi:MAG: Asp-tRNA(Asn)/Glu-tRNA(Gln) amidotransferase GatCAB subunit B [Caldiserica bacterium]|nr:MAG: Asp-tRNA(Asn)/Glu-tRNA(Gln) amidotransferase GatCAB subunit B [Caldisericota bacterium]
MDWEVVIGLEVHVQLKTKSKMFCSCSTDFDSLPNENICPICTGQPGVLPKINRRAIELALIASKILNCKINRISRFARKNYFYPDLPKNYQISQYEEPIGYDGYLELPSGKRIGIMRVHQEEDTGKLLHYIGSRKLDYSLIDFNRSGIPLLEIVSKPDIRSPEEAVEYLTFLRLNLIYAGISDCDMEKGSLRCDANLSVRRKGEKELGVKVEVKNMNSFKSVKDALSYEARRQIKLLEKGEKIIQETRLWDERGGVTKSMRRKEYAHDYRYFPDPDLVELEFDEEFLNEVFSKIPELPLERRRRYIDELSLSEYEADVFISNKEASDFFEEVIKGENDKSFFKEASSWILNDLLGILNERKLSFNELKLKPEHLKELVKLKISGKITSKIGKEIFPVMLEKGEFPSKLLKELDMEQIQDEDEIRRICSCVLKENQKVVEDYKKGKKQAIGRLVGEVMKKTRGRANPRAVNEILRNLLESSP